MNHLLPPKEGVIHRLTIQPSCLDMKSFSHQIAGETTWCLAGLILQAARVRLKYGSHGFAIGFELGEALPSDYWIEYEISISHKSSEIYHHEVILAAKARECWATFYGVESAKKLPFYDADWERKPEDVTPKEVIRILEIITMDRGLPN